MNKNTILSIIFAILLLIFFATQFLGSDDDRSLREVLVAVDTTKVTRIVLDAKAGIPGVILEKTNGSWMVTGDSLSDQAHRASIKSILSSLVKVVPERLVAKSEEQWGQYDVTDSLGTRVEVFGADKLLADLVIGKANLQRSSGTMSSFARLYGEEEVYAVGGLLSSVFNKKFNELRDRTFLAVEKADLTLLRFEYPDDSSFVLKKVNGRWQLNESPADSAAVVRYLSSLQNFTPGDFAHFTPEGKTATYLLSLEGDDMAAVTIKGFKQEEGLLLHSSLNDNAWFKTGSSNAFKDLFAAPKIFLADQPDR